MRRLTVATHYVVTMGCFRAAWVSSLTPSPRTACSHSVSRCHVAARDVATKRMTSHKGQKTTTGDEGRGLTLQPLPRPPTIDESGEKTANGDICRHSLSSFTLPPPPLSFRCGTRADPPMSDTTATHIDGSGEHTANGDICRRSSSISVSESPYPPPSLFHDPPLPPLSFRYGTRADPPTTATMATHR
jgi:hypothetical protein